MAIQNLAGASPAAIAAARHSIDPDKFVIAKDRLNGAQAIADFLGLPLFRVQTLIRKKLIPVAKDGHRSLYASRRALVEHYAKATGLEPKKVRAA
jgi:hypothetical protein